MKAPVPQQARYVKGTPVARRQYKHCKQYLNLIIKASNITPRHTT